MKAVPQLDDEAADECRQLRGQTPPRLAPGPAASCTRTTLPAAPPGPGARNTEAMGDGGCREGAPGWLLLEVSLVLIQLLTQPWGYSWARTFWNPRTISPRCGKGPLCPQIQSGAEWKLGAHDEEHKQRTGPSSFLGRGSHHTPHPRRLPRP